MKIPLPVLSNCLAHGLNITGENLPKNLRADKALGFSGMVIPPSLMDQKSLPPTTVARIFKEEHMLGLVYVFNPGDGPDPLTDGGRQCIESLRRQAEYAIAFADAGCGPEVIVGPMHTVHKKERTTWPADGFRRWMDTMHMVATEINLKFLLKPLNGIEDGTPRAFHTLSTSQPSKPLDLKACAPALSRDQNVSDGTPPISVYSGLWRRKNKDIENHESAAGQPAALLYLLYTSRYEKNSRPSKSAPEMDGGMQV